MMGKSLPYAVLVLLQRFAQRFPVPVGDPGEEHEENVRQWSIRFAQQVAHTFPDEGYGVKRAGEGRPIGKDTLAQYRGGGVLFAWDLLVGAGTGQPTIDENPAFHDLTDTGQIFVSVDPVDYLGRGDDQPKPDEDKAEPAAPGVTYDDVVSLGRELERAYEEGPGSSDLYGELMAHLLWRYMREGYTREALIEEARTRGRGEGG